MIGYPIGSQRSAKMNAAAPSQQADKGRPRYSDRNGSNQLRQDDRGRRHVAFADGQGALFLKGHEARKAGRGRRRRSGAAKSARALPAGRLPPIGSPRSGAAPPVRSRAPGARTAPCAARSGPPAACASATTQKARRPAMLVLAEHGRSDDDDPTFDGLANLTSTLRG